MSTSRSISSSGDDVICVPDPSDHLAFHVIDAGPGADTVYGGDGFNTIRSDDLSDTVTDSASGHEIIIDAPPRRDLAP